MNACFQMISTNYLSGVCRHATFSKLFINIFDSSMAHLCSFSFGIFVGRTDLTVIEISCIQSQPKKNLF